MRPLRWVSWSAVSSLPQAEKISLEAQHADNMAAIEKHDGELVADLKVPGHTRYYLELSEAAEVPELVAYATLRNMIAQRAFDVLVFRDISRLGRTAALCMTIVGLCQRARIITYETANPPHDLTPRTGHSDQLITAINSVGAQQEIHRLQERHKMGMLGRVQRGDTANKAVYGYKLRFDGEGKRRMVIDESAAAIVRQIIARYLNGEAIYSITEWLNEAGLPSYSGKPWTQRMGANILDRIWRYAGYAELNKISKTGRPYVRAEGHWTPIISIETAELVEQERAERAKNRRIPEAIHRFTGACICGVCGGSMSSSWHKAYKPNWKEAVDLRCLRHRPTTNIREHVITDALRVAFQTLQGIDPTALAGDEEDTIAPIQSEIAAQEGTRERIEAAIRRVDDAYADGALDGERYRRQVDRLNAQLHAVEYERTRLHDVLELERRRGTRTQRIEEVIEHGLAMLETEDKATANVWFRRHLRVTVKGARIIEITYL
jgi:DNA invertase Pin-like site-specific DNA recombinase